MFFFWTSMLFSVQRAPYGWEQRSPQEHQRNNQCVCKQLSDLCWPGIAKSALLSPHLLKQVTLTPANQPMYPCYFLFLFPVIFSHDFAKTSGECFPTTTIRYMICSYLHPFSEERIVCSTNDAGTSRYPFAKRVKLYLYLISYSKTKVDYWPKYESKL